MRPSGRWRWPPPDPRVTRPWRHTTASVLGDQPRAYTEDSTALALAPGNAELLGGCGMDELILGRWEAARGHLEQAARLDPRSGASPHQLGELLLTPGGTPRPSRPLTARCASRPRTWACAQDRAMVALAQGDLARCAGGAPTPRPRRWTRPRSSRIVATY